MATNHQHHEAPADRISRVRDTLALLAELQADARSEAGALSGEARDGLVAIHEHLRAELSAGLADMSTSTPRTLGSA
jgi:hypothetical protein